LEGLRRLKYHKYERWAGKDGEDDDDEAEERKVYDPVVIDIDDESFITVVVVP
jgi:hypothetical protein